MSTLDELKKGKLAGANELSLLSCGLETFPEEIFSLSDTLEKLDLAHNNLSTLPQSFGRLKKLRILFLSFNHFKKVPAVLSQCPNLSIVGFKTNQIIEFPENALPPSLRWLILTDNKIEELPRSIGDLPLLEKVALAGNKIKELPKELSRCTNLGLLRICANELTNIPEWLPTMPKLAWLAIAGNPSCRNETHIVTQLPKVPFREFTLQEVLGQGASGITYKATWRKSLGHQEDVAVKIFKGELTSDGFHSDEIATHEILGPKPHLLTAIGRLTDVPQNKAAIVLPLIPPSYSTLGNIPSFESCTRDCYKHSVRFDGVNIITIARQTALAGKLLHANYLMHGDLYAHNTLANAKGDCFVGDFGAASCYKNFSPVMRTHFEHTDVLAYGYLLEELLTRIVPSYQSDNTEEIKTLTNVKQECLNATAQKRPTFKQISEELHS